MATSPHDEVASARRRRLTMGLVFVVSLAWLTVADEPQLLHDDTHEDFVGARRCTEVQDCPSAGVSTRVPGLEQGALWMSLLAVLRGGGASIGAIVVVTHLFLALGAAFLFVTLARRRSFDVAVGTAGLFVISLATSGAMHVLWNPSLAPLPAALLLALALHYADTARPITLAPLAFALALNLEAHPVGILAAPGALLVAGLFAPNAISAVAAPALTGTIAFAVYLLISPEAATRNASTGIAALTAGGLALGLLGLGALAALLRERAQRLGDRPRSLLVSTILAAPAVLVLLGASVVGGLDEVGSRYVIPVLAPLAYLAAEGACRLMAARSTRATVGLIAGALAMPFAAVETLPTRRLEALEVVLEELERDGFTLDEGWARLSGPSCQTSLGGLAALGARVETPRRAWDEADLLWGMVGDVDLPAGGLDRGRWRRLETPAGDAFVAELDTWVRRRVYTLCVDTVGGGPPSCRPVDLRRGIRAATGPNDAPRLRYLDDAGFVPREASEAGHGVRVVLSLPVRIPARAGRRTVRIDRSPQACGRIRFLDAEGIRASSALPAQEVVLESGQEDQEGTLRVELDRSGCGGLMHVLPPCLSELADGDDPALRALLTP